MTATHPSTAIQADARSDARDTTDTEQTTPIASWLLLALLFTFNVLANLDHRILLLLVEPIKKDLGLSDVQISLLLGPAFALFFALFGIPLGWAADRFPRRWVIYFGVTFWSLFTTLSALARSFGVLFLARAAVGVGEAALSPASYSLLTDKFPRKRLSIALATFSFAPKIGYSLALIVGGVLFHFATGLVDRHIPILGEMRAWQLCFVLVGVPGILLALLALLISEPRRERVVAEPRGTTSGGMKGDPFSRFLVANWFPIGTLVLGYGFVALAAGALVSWVPTYMSRRYGYTPAQAGTVIGLIGLVSVAVLVGKAMIVDWLYTRGHKDIYVRFYVWVLAVTLPLVVVSFQVHNPILFLSLFGIMQMLTLSFPMFQALTAQSIVPNGLRGRMAALFLILTQVMFGLGPMLPALLTDYVLGGPQTLGLAMGIAAAGALVIALFLLSLSLGEFRRLLEDADRANATH